MAKFAVLETEDKIVAVKINDIKIADFGVIRTETENNRTVSYHGLTIERKGFSNNLKTECNKEQAEAFINQLNASDNGINFN